MPVSLEKSYLLRWLLVFLIGIFGIFVFHPFQLQELITKGQIFLVFGDELDARFITFILEHLYQSFQGKAEILSPAMFFPIKNTLGYSDSLLALEILYAPIRWWGVSPLHSMTLAVILSNALVFFCASMVLIKGFGAKLIPSLCGAFFFAFNSPKFNQLNHLQLQALFLLPLLFWILYKILHESETISNKKFTLLLCLGVTLFHIQLISAYYIAWYFFFWCLLFFLTMLFLRPLREKLVYIISKRYLAITFASILGLVESYPFYCIYKPVLSQTGWRPYSEVQGMVPRLLSFLWMGEGNYWWGNLKNYLPFYELHFNWEHRIGVGFVATLSVFVLFAYALKLIFKNAQHNFKDALICAFLITSCFFIICGISYHEFSLWHYVYHWIPGAKGVRAVSRYIIVLILPLTIASVLLLSKQKPLNSYILNFIFFLVLVEQISWKKEGFYRGMTEKRIETLANKLNKRECQSFYVVAPTGSRRWSHAYNTDALLIASRTNIPTLNGYSGQEPKDWLLGNLHDPNYKENINKWIHKHNLKKVCEIKVT
jgi:hypothetical protein